jgi:hypothetical protein
MLPLIVVALFAASNSLAQRQSSTVQIYGAPDGLTGTDCEGIMLRLDTVAIADRDNANDQPMIIIARLGRRENNPNLNRRRLRQVAEYLTRRVAKGKIVTAEGARVDGLGQLEFYVGGKLNIVFKIRRNRDLVIGCGSEK